MRSRADRLQRYVANRNFARTPEPEGAGGRGGRCFVIQKHDASTLHYDLRLEIAGVLVSWAVPKGPSTDPRDKRLALRTEDHPRAYAAFEGIIPEGEYGAGTVLLWDSGRYRNLRARGGRESLSMPASLRSGLLEVWLEGAKLNGGFALKRISNGRQPQWLLIKMKDRHADARRRPTRTQGRSVKSGRTLSELRQAGAS